MNFRKLAILGLGFAFTLLICSCDGAMTELADFAFPLPVCGDAFCDSPEDFSTCPEDCVEGGQVCGNAACEAGEDMGNCAMDCPGTCGDSICNGWYEDTEYCPIDCLGTCGDGICNGYAGENDVNCWYDCGD